MRHQKITVCLWFEDQAEEAAMFYTTIFDNSKILAISRYGEAGHEVHGRPAGTVLTVAFELDGHAFTALNGGPAFQFNEAISLQVDCETQAEVDHYWERLSEGGDPNAHQCGWLKDRFGVSWQIVPNVLPELLTDPDPGEIRTGHAGDAPDEEARHRRAEAGLGFDFDPQFTDDKAACMIVSDEAFVMLLTEPFFRSFTERDLCDTTRHTEGLFALSCDSRAEVDQMVETAVAGGGKHAMDPQDHGFMYGWSFYDPDGHHWEVMWMDPGALQK